MFLPDAVGLTGKPGSVGSALSTMAISCINRPYWNRVTAAALVRAGTLLSPRTVKEKIRGFLVASQYETKS